MIRIRFMLSWILAAGATLHAQTTIVENVKDQSTIVYRLSHALHHIEATSKEGWFRIEIDPARRQIKNVAAQVDVMTFDSGNSNRDSHAMEVIESLKYLDVTFTSTRVTQAADSITVTGKLTFHGITKEIVMKGETKWSEKKLEVQGGFDIGLTAFKVERPSLLMIPVEDMLRFTLDASFVL